jgi:hypothetical protein
VFRIDLGAPRVPHQYWRTRAAAFRTGLQNDNRSRDLNIAHRPLHLAPVRYGHVLGRSPADGKLLVRMSDEQKAETVLLLNTVVLPARFAALEAAIDPAGLFFCGDQPTTADFQWYTMGAGFLDGTYVV